MPGSCGHRPLTFYLVILVVFCFMFIAWATTLGQQADHLAGLYMVTPAIAPIVTRLVFQKPHFEEAHLRLVRTSDYFRIRVLSAGSTARRSDGVHVRVVSDQPPNGHAEAVPATLEDAYLYLTHQEHDRGE